MYQIVEQGEVKEEQLLHANRLPYPSILGSVTVRYGNQ